MAMDEKLLNEINELIYDYDYYGYMDAYDDTEEAKEDILRMYEDGTLYDTIESIMKEDETYTNKCMSILKRI